MGQDMECPFCDWKIIKVPKEAWQTAKSQFNRHLNEDCPKNKKEAGQ